MCSGDPNRSNTQLEDLPVDARLIFSFSSSPRDREPSSAYAGAETDSSWYLLVFVERAPQARTSSL